MEPIVRFRKEGTEPELGESFEFPIQVGPFLQTGEEGGVMSCRSFESFEPEDNAPCSLHECDSSSAHGALNQSTCGVVENVVDAGVVARNLNHVHPSDFR